jgi:hypothetical protein
MFGQHPEGATSVQEGGMDIPWVGPILAGVVTTPDVDRSAAAYRHGLGMATVDAGTIDARTAARWRAPAATGARYAVLAPIAGVGGAIWLVEAPPTPGYVPLRTYGWAALELSVADADAAVDGLGPDFTTLRAPAPLTGAAGPALRAAQVLGPAGEVLYLTEIRGELPPFELPAPPDPAVAAVDGVYIAVYAARDLDRARDWWETALPVRRCSDRQGAIGVLNQAFGLPASTTHRLSSLQLSGRSVVEIDQYPPDARPRPVLPGALPPGVAVVVVAAPPPHGETRGEPRVWRSPDGALLDLRLTSDLLT